MKSLVKQYSILSKRLNEKVDRTCDKPSYRKFTKEIRSVIGNGLITCGEVKVNNYPPRGEPVDGSCFFCKFYVQPLNKANKPYDACCFNNKLNFKKDMSKECSLYGIDEHPERKLK